MLLRPLLLLVALVALPASAQRPSAEAVLDAWTTDWQRAADGLEGVEMDERLVREIEGPRRPIEVVGTGRVVYRQGQRPERIPVRVTVNGRTLDPDRFSHMSRRTDRAFGRVGRELTAPPPLPSYLLRGAEALDLTDDRIDGQAAWRVALRLRRGDDRAEAWFTRSARSPRLLRLRTEGRRPDGGFLARDLAFTRVEGLDLPQESRVELTARQRRRLREYVVTVTSVGRYADHRLLR